jgi:hypothetical protein
MLQPFSRIVWRSRETSPVCTIRCLPGFFILFLSIIASQADSRTWYVRPDGFNREGASAIHLEASRRTEIQYNVLTGNRTGISLHYEPAFIRHNTFRGNSHYAIDAGDVGSGLCEYNIVWDRATGFDRVIAFYNDFFNLLDPGPANPENFSMDPEFCGAAAGNLYLQSDSPCAPGNSPWPETGLIGALPVGCSMVHTENRSWGAIKRLYVE